MKRLLITFYCLVLLTSYVFAQNDIVRSSLNDMFSELDFSRVPTGYLRDYAIDIVNIDNYNGQVLNDSNYVAINHFAGILASINSSSVGGGVYNLDTIAFKIDHLDSKTNKNLCFVVNKYNYIRQDALNAELIEYSSGKVYDHFINGIWQNPYDSDYVFAFSVSGQGIVESGATVFYTIPSSLALSNVSIESVELDVGDGNGFQSVAIGETVPAFYANPDVYDIKIRIELGNNTILQSHSQVTAVGSYSSPIIPKLLPMTDTMDFFFVHPYDIDSVTVGYRLAPGHSGIVKPFIFAEGFQINSVSSTVSMQSRFDAVFTDAAFNEIKNTYDLIYVHWHDSNEDITENADLLKKVIHWVNDEKAVNSSLERNVVMGHSMGGLISRYALSKMEEDGELHQCSSFISYDSPHLGANIPVGVLYALRDFSSFLNNNAFGAQLLSIVQNYSSFNLSSFNGYLDILDKPSVKQMLYYYVDASGNLTSTFHNDWLETLEDVGFPKGDPGYVIDNACISNGGSVSVCDTLFHFYSDLHLSYLANLFSDLVPTLGGSGFSQFVNAWLGSSSNIRLKVDVFPFKSYNTTVSSVIVKYIKHFKWFNDITYNVFSRTRQAPLSGPILDDVSGSYYSLGNYSRYLNNIVSMMNGSGFSYSQTTNVSCHDTIVFVPSASAFCTNDYNRDYYNNPPGSNCPFSSYLIGSKSVGHSDFPGFPAKDTVKWWLSNIANGNIIGANNAVSGSVYTISGITGSHSVTWTSSNTSIATVDSATGELTVLTPGLINVVAGWQENGQRCLKKRQVYCGLPPLYLTVVQENGSYLVSAFPVDPAAKGVVDRAVEAGELCYYWGIKVGSGNIVWSYSTDNTFLATPPYPSSEVTVYCKISDGNGSFGSTVYQVVQSSTEYECSLGYIEVYPLDFVQYHRSGYFPDNNIYTSQYVVLIDTSNAGATMVPTSITVGNYTFPVSSTYLGFDGKTRYCFDVLYNTNFQSSFLPWREDSLGLEYLDVYINVSYGVYQKVDIPILYLRDMELPPHL